MHHHQPLSQFVGILFLVSKPIWGYPQVNDGLILKQLNHESREIDRTLRKCDSLNRVTNSLKRRLKSIEIASNLDLGQNHYINQRDR